LLAGVEPDAPGIQALFPPPPTVAEPAPEPEPAEEPVTAPTPAAPRDAAKKKVQKSLGEF
jgi:hypothetical protein